MAQNFIPQLEIFLFLEISDFAKSSHKMAYHC
jgi:hypothetical protein